MFRKGIVLLFTGPIWWLLIQLTFIQSGAQKILANPELQSEKFINSFMKTEPLPRMIEPFFMWKGMFLVGLFLGTTVIYLNSLLSGNLLIKGVKLGILHWMIAIPWFEFYLPFNVMHEPISLVLFESILWLFTTIFLGVLLSFILNFPSKN